MLIILWIKFHSSIIDMEEVLLNYFLSIHENNEAPAIYVYPTSNTVLLSSHLHDTWTMAKGREGRKERKRRRRRRRTWNASRVRPTPDINTRTHIHIYIHIVLCCIKKKISRNLHCKNEPDSFGNENVARAKIRACITRDHLNCFSWEVFQVSVLTSHSRTWLNRLGCSNKGN